MNAGSDTSPNDAPPTAEVATTFRASGKLGCLLTAGVGLVCVGIAWITLERKAAGRFEAVAEIDRMSDEGAKMPGAAELRAAGCDQAGVVDLARTRALAQSLEDARAAKERRYPQGVDLGTRAPTAVVCAVAPRATGALTCESIAARYREVVSPTGPFAVAIMADGDLVCGAEVAGPGAEVVPAPRLRLPPLYGGTSDR